MSEPEISLDIDRLQRQGFPEVVYGKGKTIEQITFAMRRLYETHGHALATGIDDGAFFHIQTAIPNADHDSRSGICWIGKMSPTSDQHTVAVICAGTADLPTAEQAALTLEYLGYTVSRLRDVGVAGIHRLITRLDEVDKSQVIIVVAGMEGALASVIGGLARQPIIAVPTSVGYGTGLGGLAALMSMLNSCAAGMTVVNIDNGFGAAVAAHRILSCLKNLKGT
ncbi:MAG: nickel pincer cofactor biosynthesis protein LarB [Verrucomicrobiaceae bacterium]|nr:nickel pincer cofactor biosynthesis protein LarB [Verrucomicrobiaceae bacterium]